MTIKRQLTLLFALGLTFSQVSCNSSDDFDENMVQVQAYLGLAEVYRDQGQYRAAIIETQNAAALMPLNPDVQAFIADVYIEIGDITSATALLEMALAQLPDNVEFKLLLAEAYLLGNRTADGLALVEPLETNGENLLQRNWLIGNLQAASGNNQAAENTLQSVLATDPNHVQALISLSKISFLNGQTNAARDYLRQATESAGVSEEDVWIWQGQMAMLEEDYPAAEAAFFEALDIMALYDIMTAKRFAAMQSILVPLQMQGKNDEALRYSQIIAATPQGEFNSGYANAVSLFQQGSLAEAETALTDLLENAPNHPGSNILLGIARYSAGDFQEAERLLGDFVDADTASPQLVTTLASAHLRLNRPERALSVLQASLENNPDDVAIMAMIGTIQRGLGDTDASLASINEALRLEPEKAELHLALAGTYAQMENFDAAIASLNEAIELNPELTQAKSSLLDIQMRTGNEAVAQQTVQAWLRDEPASYYNNMAAALLAMNGQDFTSARNYLDEALALEPDNIQAQLYSARVDMQEGLYDAADARFTSIIEQQPASADAISGVLALGNVRQTQEASINRVKQIIDDNPTEFMPPLVLSQYYLVNNRLDESLEFAETAYSAAQNIYTINMLADVSNRLAAAALQQQNAERARTLLNRVQQVQPDNVQSLIMMTSMEAQSQNFAQAQSIINRLKEIQPDAAFTFELEGDLHRTQNDHASALTDYRAAWDRENVPGLGLKVYQTHISLNQAAEAQEFLNRWIEIDSESAAPKLLLAMDLQQRNENSQAIPYYEEVYQSDPDNLIVLNNLAWLYQDEMPERAMELAIRAAELYPQNADVLDTYGWLLLKQDEKQRAIEVLEQAAQLAPDNAGIQEHLATARQ